MNLDAAFETFLDESRTMLEDMERYLLELEDDASDDEKLNALFRCVHTIKGSAGIFALDHVVAFTHIVEDVLDRLRVGKLQLDGELAALLLKCRDHIATLIEIDPDPITGEQETAGNSLLRLLSEYQEATKADPAFTSAGDTASVRSGNWHISIRFGEDVMRNGMDPLGFMRYLATLGEVIHVDLITERFPDADEFDPESCYLGAEISLRADTSQAALEDVFEFVRDDCELRILPPGSQPSAFIDQNHALPENDAPLDEILVTSGDPSLAEKNNVETEVVIAALPRQTSSLQVQPRTSQFLRVQAEKLDSLINLVGELVIASASAGLSAQRGGDLATQEAMVAVKSLVEDIRDNSLELRMVPIGETFQRFQRVVRDVSQELDKDVRLDISGADTELDKTVVEKISDPLTHLVRNAMDHGIEPAERRAAAGKPVQGRVQLNAYHEAGSIIIEVSDDGAGLSRDKLVSKALERGVIQSAEGLSEQDIFQLIFEPGFSTAEQVTNLSGRGVGMDVVKRSIEALRGAIELQSFPGIGTTVRIRLPLTLAIIDGFLVGVGRASYVVPLESVFECVELTAAQREETQGRNFINLRGEVLPFVRLRDYFEIEGDRQRRENIVVVKYGAHKAGLIVDELLGEYQTVIKPLGKLFRHLNGISGSTILGTGDVALIVDVPVLVQTVATNETQRYQHPVGI